MRSAEFGKHVLHERWPSVPHQHFSAFEFLPLSFGRGAVRWRAFGPLNCSVFSFPAEDVEWSL